MDPNLITVAEYGLRELRKACHADLLTCYFLNPHSGLFWLFSRDGDFIYDAQMHGPLTYPGQTERLIQVIEENRILEKGFCYFDKEPEILFRSINDVKPFVVREGIVRSVWIVIRREGIRSHIDVDRENIQREVGIVIFLNYRANNKTEWDQNLKSEVEIRIKTLKTTFQLLVDQPCILDEEAWKLRNMSLRFFQELEGILVVGDYKFVGEKLQDLCNSIVEKAYELIQPESTKNARNLLCTLTMADPHNQTNLLACYPKEKRKIVERASWGIVDYVCRAGQIYMIRDTEVYERQWKKSDGSDVSLPQYVVCDRETRCELACPLVIHEKVVGVLNIEADKPNAYEKHHILLLLQFASLSALVVRQRVIWESLSKCIDRQTALFHGGVSPDDEEILLQTLAAAKSLGYKADIWDFVTKSWKQDKAREEPRKNGYTEYIAKNSRPVAIADIRKSEDSTIIFGLHKGQLNKDSMLFEKWSIEAKIPYLISQALQRDAESLPPVLNDMGFPIFEDTNSDRQDEKPKVRAVLWAKCQRRFMSVLHDESWALSFLCRNASMALGIRKIIREKFEARKTCVNFHFGEERGQKIDENLQRDETSLDPKAVKDTVVLHIDIRGSTMIGRKLLEMQQTKEYVAFIRKYHKSVFEKANEYGGVVDKTMGDGVQLLFNIYRHDLVDLQPYDTQIKAAESAVRCALGIFKSFSDFWKSKEYRAWSWQGGPVGLGAGLAIGDGFVGSFSGMRGSDMDYTVLGDVANRAGKLVNLARQDTLSEWIRQTRDGIHFPHIVTNDGNARKVKKGVLTALLGKLTDSKGISLLLIEPISSRLISHDLYKEVLTNKRTSAYKIVNEISGVSYLVILFDPNL